MSWSGFFDARSRLNSTRCWVRDFGTDEDVREWLDRPYRVIFRVKSDQVEMISVLHFRELLPPVFTC